VRFKVEDHTRGREVKRVKLRQRAIDAVRGQFGRPTGLWGRAAGLLMAHRSSNRRRNSWAVSLLDVRRDDRVLEIGFGPGLAIRALSRLATEGYVCGIDHSQLMLRSARRRNAEGVRRGVVDLRLGSVAELPEFDEPFDKILAVNAMMFWGEPVARLAELRSLLRAGGLIAVVHQPRGPGATDETSAAKGRELAATLDSAGFTSVRVETMRLKPAVVCALGINEAGAWWRSQLAEAGPVRCHGTARRARRRGHHRHRRSGQTGG
jgi:SAM-dependent methyltransferase